MTQDLRTPAYFTIVFTCTRRVMEHKCLFVYDMFPSYRKLKQRKTSWLDFFVLRPNIFYEKMFGFYCFSKLYLLKDWLSPIPNIGVSQYLSELEYQLITHKMFFTDVNWVLTALSWTPRCPGQRYDSATTQHILFANMPKFENPFCHVNRFVIEFSKKSRDTAPLSTKITTIYETNIVLLVLLL